jgi:hypothetical protein
MTGVMLYIEAAMRIMDQVWPLSQLAREGGVMHAYLAAPQRGRKNDSTSADP